VLLPVPESLPPLPSASRRTRSLLLAILLTSLALKLGLVWAVRDMGCLADECDYLLLAQRLAFGEGFQEIRGYLWPPGYVGFLAGCLELFGPHRFVPRLFQVAFSTLTVLAVFGIGRRLYGERPALLAAALVAFYPNLVAFSHLLWSETLYIFLSTTALALVLGRRRGPRLPIAVLAGVLLGLGALVRSVGLYVALLVGLWMLWQARRDPRRAVGAVVVVAAALLTVAPWTARNALRYERFCPVDATMGQNLYLGHNLGRPASWDHGLPRPSYMGPEWRPFCVDENVIDRDRCEVAAAVDFMAAHPGMTLRRVPTKLADLLNPSSFAIRHARVGKYAAVDTPGRIRVLTVVAAGAWMALALLALGGLLLRRAQPGVGLIWALLCLTLAIHALTFGTSRFRLALIPLLALPAAAALLAPAGAPPASTRRLRLAAFAVGTFLLLAAFAARGPVVFDVF